MLRFHRDIGQSSTHQMLSNFQWVKQFSIGQIHFLTIMATIKTFTPHEKWHIPAVQEPKACVHVHQRFSCCSFSCYKYRCPDVIILVFMKIDLINNIILNIHVKLMTFEHISLSVSDIVIDGLAF